MLSGELLKQGRMYWMDTDIYTTGGVEETVTADITTPHLKALFHTRIRFDPIISFFIHLFLFISKQH
jgi:hypothetical protein